MPYTVMNPYVPVTDFSDDEAQQTGGRSTVDTSGLDAEFLALVTATEALRNNLLLIQRSDGLLEDNLVQPENLSTAVRTLMLNDFVPKGAWTTAIAYAINDLVKETAITYICVEAHTSGVFATDLAANKWIDLGDLTPAEVKTAYESNADTNAFTDALLSKLNGVELLADVTDTANVTLAGALMDSEVDADLKTFVLPANTTISAFGRTLVDDAAAINARATLGLIIGTDVQAWSAILDATTASFLAADETKLDGIEALADVTDITNVDASGAIMDANISAAEGFLRKTGSEAYEAIKSNLGATVDPTVNEDSGDGYAIGSLWINVTGDRVFQAVDVTVGAAVWKDLSGAAAGGLTLGTKQATTSGTAIDFTGLPAGVKRVMISFQGVSLSGTDNMLVQLGDSGGFETTNYISTGGIVSATPSSISSTVGFVIRIGEAAGILSATMTLNRMDNSSLWISSHSGKKNTGAGVVGGGDKTLSAELTQIRLTRTGTDTFDAGSVNIMYE